MWLILEYTPRGRGITIIKTNNLKLKTQTVKKIHIKKVIKMKIIKKVKDMVFTVSGCLFMLLVLFYLRFYEFKPIYKPTSL